MKQLIGFAGSLATAIVLLSAETNVARAQAGNIFNKTGTPPIQRDDDQTGIPPIERDATEIVYTLRAQIDGRSQLTLDDRTAQWHHYDLVAPGRYSCARGGKELPTFIRKVEWYPEWPDTTGCENVSCDCSSNVFHFVMPPIPNLPMGAYLMPVAGRGVASIVENPTRSNGYRVVVEFNDSAFEGVDWYEVDLVVWFAQQEVFCHSEENSTGMVGDLEMTGSMSIARNDVELYSGNLPVGLYGQFFYGADPASLPFGDGILCVNPFKPGLIRLRGVSLIDEAGGAESHLDFLALGSRGAILPGQKWYFQFWFRDPKPGGAGFNLSDGLMAVFVP
jgi:hypothetical protein